VSFLVEGSVRRAGDRIRVTAQLVEAGTAIHLWAERYDRHLDDVFAVQDDAQMIASALFGRIEDARLQQALRKPTDSMEAYDCFLRGLAHFRSFAEDSNQQAAAMLERAVRPTGTRQRQPIQADAHLVAYARARPVETAESLFPCC
jgi:hypothetical protein